MDLFVVTIIGFKLLYGFVIVRIDCRDLVWINATTNTTTEWIARQITETFPWDGASGTFFAQQARMGFSVHTAAANSISIDPQVPEGDVKACCSGATETAASPPRSEPSRQWSIAVAAPDRMKP
jgi:hypothetical protein